MLCVSKCMYCKYFMGEWTPMITNMDADRLREPKRNIEIKSTQ